MTAGKPVRIAVDARPLGHPGTGIYRYTSELLKRMCPLGGEWFLYSPQPYDTSEFSFPNVRHRTLGISSRFRASQLGSFIFPFWVREDAIEVFWGPRHQLPLFLPQSIRAIVTIYDLVWLRYGETMRFPGRQIESLMMPRALARADQVVAVSEFTRTELAACFPQSEEKVTVIPGSSHFDSVSTSMVPREQGGEPYFLFVGTMEPRKNLQRLLQAYHHYVGACEAPLKLKIVGGRGWGGVETQIMADELGIAGYLEVLGSVEESTLHSLYAGAHALVMPSLYEGFGLPIAESLSLGVPVITSRDSAMSEVAGEAGILVDPLNVEEISMALGQLTTDTERHRTLAARTYTESQRYDWGASAESMYKVIHE